MSHQSQFLLIVPEGWVEVLDFDAVIAAQGVSIDTIEQAISDYPSNIEPFIELTPYFPPGNTVTDVRLFKEESIHRLWIKYVPLP